MSPGAVAATGPEPALLRVRSVRFRDVAPALRTARHTRPIQYVGYALDRFARLASWVSPVSVHAVTGVALGAVEPDRELLAAWGRQPECVGLAPRWEPDVHGDPRAGVYRFQGRERRWEGRVDWELRDMPALWRFHLAYLDTVGALAAAEPDGPWQPWLAELLADLWESTSAGRGAVWMPFPVAVRLQNLLRLWAMLEARGGAIPDLDRELRRHCAALTGWLMLRIEIHLQANHLLKELSALACALRVFGVPGLREAVDGWLQRQLAVQFLAGGGHEERSPSYHLACVRDLVELEALLRVSGGQGRRPGVPRLDPERLRQTIRRALDFAASIEHLDGDVPLFNDCSLGSWPDRARLAEVAGHASPSRDGLVAFPEEGYFAARAGDSHLVFDCGPVSADHQAAHAHCDLLSFELSHRGRRVFSNRGTLAYGDGPERTLGRSVESHNTVQIGDEEQVEIWGAFRVGWRGRPQLLEAVELDGSVRLAGRFDWRPGVGAAHRRSLDLQARGRLEVVDEVDFSRAPRRVTARYYLPGAAVVDARGDGALGDLRIAIGDRQVLLRGTDATLQAAPVDWFPKLGVREPALRVEVHPRSPGRFVRFGLIAELA